MRRIVVSGCGLVSPLGCGVGHVWHRLLAGRSGIRRLPESLVADVSAKVAGIVPNKDEDPEAGYDSTELVSLRDSRRMDRFIQLAITAAHEAIMQARWSPRVDEQRDRTATIIASGLGSDISKCLDMTFQ